MTVNHSSRINNLHACLQRVRLLLHLCPHPSVCWRECVSVWVWGSDSSSPGNPSRLPGQPAPTSWCMRSRWSGVAATTAQPYLITNKRVVPSVRYQAFSAKQTVIPASQTLALLPPSLRGESYIEIRRSGCNPMHHLYIQPHAHIHTNTHMLNLNKPLADQDLLLRHVKEMSVPVERSFYSPSLALRII